MSVPDPTEDPSACAQSSVDCTDALHELQQYLDGELPEGDLVEIRAHLAACYPCADRATFEEQLRALIRERCAESAPPSLVAGIRARLDEFG